MYKKMVVAIEPTCVMQYNLAKMQAQALMAFL